MAHHAHQEQLGRVRRRRLPHKQFYEYLIAKAAWTILHNKTSRSARIYAGARPSNHAFGRLLSEDVSIDFFSEMIGAECSAYKEIFGRRVGRILVLQALLLLVRIINLVLFFRKKGVIEVENLKDRNRVEWKDNVQRKAITAATAALGATLTFALPLGTGLFFIFSPLEKFVKALGVGGDVAPLLLSLAAPVAALFCLAWMMNAVTDDSLNVLRKVVTGKLFTAKEAGGKRLPLQSIYEECIYVLWQPSKSSLCGARETSTHSELRELISPLV